MGPMTVGLDRAGSGKSGSSAVAKSAPCSARRRQAPHSSRSAGEVRSRKRTCAPQEVERIAKAIAVRPSCKDHPGRVDLSASGVFTCYSQSGRRERARRARNSARWGVSGSGGLTWCRGRAAKRRREPRASASTKYQTASISQFGGAARRARTTAFGPRAREVREVEVPLCAWSQAAPRALHISPLGARGCLRECGLLPRICACHWGSTGETLDPPVSYRSRRGTGLSCRNETPGWHRGKTRTAAGTCPSPDHLSALWDVPRLPS